MAESLGEKRRLSLGEDASYFVSEFISRMRNHPEIGSKPSIRQGSAITALLLSRQMRKGGLSARDFLRSAVMTSLPENQAIAYGIAWEILFGRKEKQGGQEEKKGGEINGMYPSEEERKIGKTKPWEGKPSGSGVGGGDEQIMEWWAKFHGDAEYRRRLMKKAERIILNSGSKSDYTFSTREEAGPLEGDMLRRFSPGDDPESIDYEETIEELVGQGRDLSQVRYDDFILRERRRQRKAAVILQDVSGSMDLGLKPSLLCAAILLCALRNHEIALALFEGNQYIIKRFFDKKPWEEVFDAILSAKLRAQGGTVGGKTLRWCKEELKKIDGRYWERECVIFSDFGFFDRGRVMAEIKEISDMGTRIIIFLPPIPVYRTALYLVSAEVDCKIIQIDRVEEDCVEEKVEKLAEIIGSAI
jgi:hypothetical protein